MAALAITATTVAAASDAVTVTGTAGATITAGQAVYLDANGVYQKSRGNALLTSQCDGIALNGASASQPLSVCTSGTVAMVASGLGPGLVYYVSDAADGSIIPVADLGTGDYVTFLAVGVTEGTFRLDIQEGGVAKA